MKHLTSYRRKRDFNKTSEPKGKKKTVKKKTARLYVIQKHSARHLHYDLRLEWGGVLKSWAVPKGPSPDPQIKRLAIEVEDHPLEYGTFEGTIPKGQYGAGKVEVWDIGSWQPVGSAQKSYQKGDITFDVFGKKLTGRWKLIKIKSQDPDKPRWLLMHIHDTKMHASDPKPKIKKTTQKRTKTSVIFPKQPTYIKPQLATLVQNSFDGREWLHEVKYDGYRIIAVIKDGEVKLYTRNKHNWTDKLAIIAQALKKITVNCILDGEVVALEKGISRFEVLQNELNNPDANNLQYKIFDIMYYDGRDLTHTPLIERKKLLSNVLKKIKNNKFFSEAEYIIGSGEKVFKKACHKGLEGIMSKRLDSTYEQRRTQTWVKQKCLHEEEYVIAGFTRPSGARKYFGALLLGYYHNKRLVYCGRVGTGFTEDSLRALYQKMHKLIQAQSPFEEPPQLRGKKIIWLKPKLVAQLRYVEKTQKGLLRTPSFLGLRLDKSGKEVRGEVAKKLISTARLNTIKLSHLQNVIKITQHVTKEQVVEYYQKISQLILPHLKDRPLSLLRCPTTSKECFFQKNFTTKGVQSLEKIIIKEKSRKINYLCAKTKADLLYLVQGGVLEIHPWGSRKDAIENPDRITFDLDPAPGVEWTRIIESAFYVRDVLQKIGLTSFVKTTGGKGLHIVVPITRHHSWTEIKLFTKSLAIIIAKMYPDLFTATMSKEKRKNKIFIDYLRNSRGATAVAPYSLRAHVDAPISMPVSWKELKTIKSSAQFNIFNIDDRMAKRHDPWKGFFQCRQSIPAAFDK